MQRTIRFWLAAAIVFAASSVMAAAQFHGGPEHRGVFDTSGPDGFFKPVWRFNAGHMIVASPVLDEGVVYAGAKNGMFYALDAKAGTLKWRFAADAPITSTAAVSNGIAYFASNANTIYAVRVADGRELWHRATGADLPFDAMAGFAMVEDWDYWNSSPLVLGERIFIGSGDGHLYALDARTGAVLWSHAMKGRVRASPASDGRSVYAGDFAGEMVALDARSGRQRWSFHTKGNPTFPAGSIQSSPALADGLVLFGARDFNLYAIDAATGREAWHQSIKNSWVPSTPAIEDGRVYTGSADGRALFAYDLKSGKQLWSTDLDNLVFSSPVLANGVVYIATMGGSVFAVSASDGKVIGFTLTQDRVLSTPWIADGMIYFGDNDGYLYAFAAGPHKYPGG